MSIASAYSAEDAEFDKLVEIVQRRAAGLAGRPLLLADAPGLFDVYLNNLPDRKSHDCAACRVFFERYGALALVDDAGKLEPLFWDAAGLPPKYVPAVSALAAAVRDAPLNGVFFAKEPAWGVIKPNGWRHLCVPSPAPFTKLLLTPGQAMAEKREEFGMLLRGLAEFPQEIVAKACALLQTDTLYRSEKVSGVAEWLLALHEQRAAIKNERARDNFTWRAVATAPAGFCHVKSTMISTLLDDLVAGLPVSEVQTRFAAKMHPLQYLRPQNEPTEANIAQAEKVIATLKSAGSLERRYARLADLQTIWKPRPEEPRPKGEGVFAHLTPRASKSEALEMDTPPIAITWAKFARDVLPGAEAIDCLVPTDKSSFLALVTAVNPDAPPIIQWDYPDARNPVSWYMYNGGSLAADWNLKAGTYCPVTAFSLGPPKWNANKPSRNQGNSAIAILQGARDLRGATAGAALFPEVLKNDYHAIRRTIEAHSRSMVLAGLDESDASGLVLSGSGPWRIVFRVRSKGLVALYSPDRWD